MRVAVPTVVESWFEAYGKTIGSVLIVCYLGFLWLPILIITLMSFAGGLFTFPPEELTLQWYRSLATNERAIDAARVTLRVSAVATPLAVVLSTMAAYAIERYAFRGRNLFVLLIVLPIVVPMVITGVAMLFFLNTIGLDSGYTSVVIGHTVRAMPFATLVILPSFVSFDRSLEEAAMDLGANEIETFYRVTLPNVLPGIVAGAMLAFAISFNEFIYTFFLRDTVTVTLPIHIWNEIVRGANPELNAISVIFIVVAVLSVLTATALTHVERISVRSS